MSDQVENQNVAFLIKRLICFLPSLSGHAIGRDAFLEQAIIPPVAKLFDDKEDIARKNAHQAIEMVSETPPGIANFPLCEHLRTNKALQ